jgi:signal transduction histidine kinase
MKNESGRLVGIINLFELDDFLKDLFLDKLRISCFYLMIRDETSGDFETITLKGEQFLQFSGTGELAGKLDGYRKIMNIQQMSLAWHEGEELSKLYARKIVLIAPLFEKFELIGFCLFGEPGPARAWYPSEIEELELFLSGVPVVIARCNTHEQAIILEKKQALIEKMAVLNEISSGIAHEIRNPLSIISASAETMVARDLSSADVKKYASYIQDETARMSRLLNRILSISGNSDVSHSPVNVINIIQRSLDLLATKLRKKNLVIDFKHRQSVYIAIINSEVLMQICLNIILNAIDAMSEGMKLRVEADYFMGSKVKIVFANQGEAIPEDLRGRIFDPFFTTKKTGTGLGLSITQRLIKEARGEIMLLDSEDETIFQILLPAASDFMR